MVIVSPSILSADFANLGEDCRRILDAGAEWLHYDVMDGSFVPNISMGLPVLAGLHAAVPAFYDVHLMIEHPERYVERFCEAGANLLTLHIEALPEPREALAAIRAAGAKAALCIKPSTSPEAVYPYLKLLDMVLVMSVEPGFGGQKFMPQALEKLRALRAEAKRQSCEKLLLQVDGGINAETGAQCVAAGADVLVAGSAVFGAPDPATVIAALHALNAGQR